MLGSYPVSSQAFALATSFDPGGDKAEIDER